MHPRLRTQSNDLLHNFKLYRRDPWWFNYFLGRHYAFFFFLFRKPNEFYHNLSSEVRIDDSPFGLVKHSPGQEILWVKKLGQPSFTEPFPRLHTPNSHLWALGDLCLQDMGSEDLEDWADDSLMQLTALLRFQCTIIHKCNKENNDLRKAEFRKAWSEKHVNRHQCAHSKY